MTRIQALKKKQAGLTYRELSERYGCGPIIVSKETKVLLGPKPKQCPKCKNKKPKTKLVCHHISYWPERVTWICTSCHAGEHGRDIGRGISKAAKFRRKLRRKFGVKSITDLFFHPEKYSALVRKKAWEFLKQPTADAHCPAMKLIAEKGGAK